MGECGTPAHMAPEVYRRRYTEKCDLWSIGTTFHCLCVGRPPFYDKDEYKMRDSILRDPDVDQFLKRPDFKTRWDLVKGDKEGIHGLIKQLLVSDQSNRASAREVISNNEWLKKREGGEAGFVSTNTKAYGKK